MNTLELNWQSKLDKQLGVKNWLIGIANSNVCINPVYLLEMFRIKDFVKFLFKFYGVDKEFPRGQEYKNAISNVTKRFRQVNDMDYVYETCVFQCFKEWRNGKPVMKVRPLKGAGVNILRTYQKFINTKNMDTFSISRVNNKTTLRVKFMNWRSSSEYKDWVVTNTWQQIPADSLPVRFIKEVPHTVIPNTNCYCVKSLADEMPLLQKVFELYNDKLQCSVKPYENYPTCIITNKGAINVRYSQNDSMSTWMPSDGLYNNVFVLHDKFLAAIPIFPTKYINFNAKFNPFANNLTEYSVGINTDWIASIKIIIKNKTIIITQHASCKTSNLWLNAFLV